MTGLSAIGAATTVVLAVAMAASLLLGPSAKTTLDCSPDAPSSACLALLPEDLRALPTASLGVWFYAQNAEVKRSPRRYLEAEADWAASLGPNPSADDVSKRSDGHVPSASALEGELRMREAVLLELWEPSSSDYGLQRLALPLGLGALAMLGMTVVTGLRSRKWTPIPVAVTPETVSFGSERRAIEDVLAIEVAPLKLLTTTGDLGLPPDYVLAQADHERLMEVLQQAIELNRASFFDDDTSVSGMPPEDS